jgi:hypothetical protein
MPSDLFADHWRCLARCSNLTICSEPFGYARKVRISASPQNPGLTSSTRSGLAVQITPIQVARWKCSGWRDNCALDTRNEAKWIAISALDSGYPQIPHIEQARGRPTRSKLLICMVRPERFELPTLWFEAKCSIQLSYGRAKQVSGLQKHPKLPKKIVFGNYFATAGSGGGGAAANIGIVSTISSPARRSSS